MTYEIVKRNYERKLWNTSMVRKAVEKGVVTPEQFETITGESYQ